MSVFKFNSTGALAIASSVTVPAGQVYQLISITLHLDGTPTTSESLTITLDANAGSAYDTVLFSLDLSLAPTVDLVYTPEQPLIFEGEDIVSIAFANTETNTYGLQVTMGSMV